MRATHSKISTHQPCHGDESASRVVVVRLGREYRNDDGPDDERQSRERVSPDERATPTKAVDEPDAQALADKRNDRVSGLEAERRRSVDAYALEDARCVVLDDTDARHLDTEGTHETSSAYT